MNVELSPASIAAVSVSVWRGRLKVTEGLGEQTVPGNPDLLFLLQQPGVDRDS